MIPNTLTAKIWTTKDSRPQVFRCEFSCEECIMWNVTHTKEMERYFEGSITLRSWSGKRIYHALRRFPLWRVEIQFPFKATKDRIGVRRFTICDVWGGDIQYEMGLHGIDGRFRYKTARGTMSELYSKKHLHKIPVEKELVDVD